MSSLKKVDLLKKISETSGVKKNDVESVLDTLDTVTIEALKGGQKVSLGKIVSVKPVEVPARSGTINGKTWSADAHTGIKATVADKYKKLS